MKFSILGEGTDLENSLAEKDYSGVCDVFSVLGVWLKRVEIFNGDFSSLNDELPEGVYLLQTAIGNKLIHVRHK